MAARSWTSEQRKLQAEAIQRWKPWASSTGPRTDAGKAVSRGNAYAGAMRPRLRALSRAIDGQHAALKKLMRGIE